LLSNPPRIFDVFSIGADGIVPEKIPWAVASSCYLAAELDSIDEISAD